MEMPPPARIYSCCLGASLVLLRQSVAGMQSLFESQSAVEQMVVKMLATTGRRPSEGEVRSWNASMPVLVNDLMHAWFYKVEVLFEQQLPLTSKRVDAVLAGVHPKTGLPSYVVVELKQWSRAELFESDPNLVLVDAYGNNPVAHPLDQVSGYRQYMLDFLPALHDRQESIHAAAYLHNATERSVMDLREFPQTEYARMFTGERKSDFFDFLFTVLDPAESGTKSADELLNMKAGPSKQLMAVAAEEIQKREQFVLLGEQRLAFDLVMHEVTKAQQSDKKTVIVITGGPGSGKSVIALSLLGELSRQGRTAIHATGSRSFTMTLRQVAGKGSTRVKQMFKYFNSFMDAEKNGLEVLILDEAHRIRETSENRYTKAAFRQGRPQVDELISAARVPVFLLDQHQVVRPGELGTVDEISEYARGLGLEVREISLDDQFRCGGSQSYINWVQRLLGLEVGGPIPWEGDPGFEVQIVDSPQEMESLLTLKVKEGFGARMTAGYCWKWSNPLADGSLVPDVIVGDWSKPWNLRGDRAVGGAPPSALWATDPAGFGQVGCVYTAQGFEYDWNGVILGPDLVWRTDKWMVNRSENKDPDFRNSNKVSGLEFERLVKNVYKVLLTRGLSGTYLMSVDAETQSLLQKLFRLSRT